MLLKLSSFILPLLLFLFLLMGVKKKIPVYDVFVRGAEEGIKIVVRILPTLIGLMLGVGVLRASGLLNALGGILGEQLEKFGIGKEIIPLIFMKLFSSSASTGLVLDIFREYGPDSKTGWLAAVMMSCTETCFYTMSVYYMAAKVYRTRWTLPGALLATLAGLGASFFFLFLL